MWWAQPPSATVAPLMGHELQPLSGIWPWGHPLVKSSSLRSLLLAGFRTGALRSVLTVNKHFFHWWEASFWSVPCFLGKYPRWMWKENIFLYTHSSFVTLKTDSPNCPFHSGLSLLPFFPTSVQTPPSVRDSRCLCWWETQFLLPQGARHLGSYVTQPISGLLNWFSLQKRPPKKLPRVSESRAFITIHGWLLKKSGPA